MNGPLTGVRVIELCDESGAIAGKLMGDLTISRLAEDRFWIIGSYYLQEWHMRWFRASLPDHGATLRNITDTWTGFALSGPQSTAILQKLSANFALPFFACTEADLGFAPALIARLSLTGETGYEITVPWAAQRQLHDALKSAGATSIGNRALDSLRLEKSYGIWSREFTQAVTPAMCGLDRAVDVAKGDFVGREAFLKDQPAQRLVTFEIDADDIDASGHEPVRHGAAIIGQVTSGAFGHHTGRSLAMAYVDTSFGGEDCTIELAGVRRRARLLHAPAYDPAGARLRS